MKRAQRIRLTGRAQRFLHLLQDFGHIDEHDVEDILVNLADLARPPHETTVDLADVRRAAAELMFGDGDEESVEEIEKGILAEDWPFMFS